MREPPGTLLVLVARPQPLLVFSSTFGHVQTAEERADLIRALQNVVGPRWDDAWLQSGAIVERYLLHAVVSEGLAYAETLRAALVSLMTGAIPASLQATVDAYPILRSPMALAALEELTDVQASPMARKRGRMVAALLRGCRAWGFEDLLADFEEAVPRYASALDQVVAGDATPAVRALAAARGELLRELASPEQSEWLKLTLQVAEFLTDSDGESAERGLDLYLDTLDVIPEGAPGRTRLLHDLGIALYQRRDGDRAQNIERSLTLLDQALERVESVAQQVQILTNRASVLCDRLSGDRSDNIERAIGDLGRAKELVDHDRGGGRYAHVMYTLGNSYQQRLTGEPLLNLERACMAYELAVDHWPPSDAIGLARARAALAGVYFSRLVGSKEANLATAIEHASASLQVLTAERSPRECLAANLTLGLAIGADPQRLGTAVDVITAALAATEGATAAADRAHALSQLALLYGRRANLGREEDVERAVAAYEAALRLLPAPGSVRERIECLRSLGNLHFRHQRWTDAAKAYSEAHAIEGLLDTEFSEPARRARLSGAGAAGSRWAYALARCDLLDAAVVAIDRIRAWALRQALGGRYPDLRRLQVTAPELHGRYLQAAESVAAMLAAERKRSMSNVQGRGVVAPEGLAAAYANMRRMLDETLTAIRRMSGFECFNADAEIADIWKAVLPDKPLAYLVTTEAGTLALLLHHHANGPRIEQIRDDELTSDVVQRLLVQWPGGKARGSGQFVVTEPDPSNPNELSLSWEGELPIGGYLDAQIREPENLAAEVRAVREAFAGIMRRVVARLEASSVGTLQLVTTGKLGLLPIHAALPGAMSREQSVEAVGFAPSAMVLDALRTADRDKAGQKATLAGVANPLPHPVPLPFAPFELARITRRFPEGAWCKLENFDATREAVLSLLARGPEEDGISYVHMACHGQYDLVQPLASELSLAGGKGLELVELLNGDLLARTRLVTLSACQTAVVSDLNHVPDEMGSIATAFLAAGATGVVGTLWAVDDLACALLFDRFYGELLRSDGTRATEPAVALARAQQWLRTVTALALEALFDDASRAFEVEHGKAHPLLVRAARHFGARPADEACFGDAVYWAGFIYVGA